MCRSPGRPTGPRTRSRSPISSASSTTTSAARPIGFTRAAGNFEAVDGDAILAETMDGADTDGGLPDGNHIDNANMATPPDGLPPRMQMFLFHQPPFGAGDPFLPGNGGDGGDIVYHEYLHGVSNRLVIDALGNSTLGALQSGAMGEAWGDWYGYDFLVAQGVERDTRAHGELIVGKYVEFGGQGLVRSEGLDCPVGSTEPACPRHSARGTRWLHLRRLRARVRRARGPRGR